MHLNWINPSILITSFELWGENTVKTTADSRVVMVWAVNRGKVRVEWVRLPLCSARLTAKSLFPSFVFTDPMWFSHRQPHQVRTRVPHVPYPRVRSPHSSCSGSRCLQTSALESLISINRVHVIVITALLSWHPWSRGTAAPYRPPCLFLCPCSSVLQSTFTQVIQLGMGSSGYNALYIQVKYQSV